MTRAPRPGRRRPRQRPVLHPDPPCSRPKRSSAAIRALFSHAGGRAEYCFTCRASHVVFPEPRSRVRRTVLVLVLLGLAWPAAAQSLPIDRLTPPWAPAHQRAASIASNVTLWSTVAVDTWSSLRAPDRTDALVKQGLREGLVLGSGLLVKMLVHRTRPCAPACGLDNPRYSFFSGHTALAFSTTDARLAITIPLASSTGYFRIAANKHWLSDVGAGALVGILAGRYIR